MREMCLTSILTSQGHSVKANAAIWKSIHDFLFNFNGNYGPICKRFQVTALRNMRDLDFDLSRSLQVKANGHLEHPWLPIQL